MSFRKRGIRNSIRCNTIRRPRKALHIRHSLHIPDINRRIPSNSFRTQYTNLHKSCKLRSRDKTLHSRSSNNHCKHCTLTHRCSFHKHRSLHIRYCSYYNILRSWGIFQHSLHILRNQRKHRLNTRSKQNSFRSNHLHFQGTPSIQHSGVLHLPHIHSTYYTYRTSLCSSQSTHHSCHSLCRTGL